MKSLMKRVVRHVTTGYDDKTYDTGRILAWLYFLSATVFTGFDVWRGAHFEAASYLTGGGAFLGGLAVYLFGDMKGKQIYDSSPTNSDVPKS